MSEWGFNPGTVQAVGAIGVATGLIATFAGIFLAERHNRRSRNLDAILVISMDMRGRWENGWESILRDQAPKMDLEARQQGEVGQQLTNMLNWLNWLDWMGVMVKNKWIHKELVFGTLYSIVREILLVTAHQIQTDIDNLDRGKRWWANALYMAEQPEINVDIAAEAERLRREWNHPLAQLDPSEGDMCC